MSMKIEGGKASFTFVAEAYQFAWLEINAFAWLEINACLWK